MRFESVKLDFISPRSELVVSFGRAELASQRGLQVYYSEATPILYCHAVCCFLSL